MASNPVCKGCHRGEVNCLPSANNCQGFCSSDKLESACFDVYPQELQVQLPQPFDELDPLDEWIAYNEFDFPHDNIEDVVSTSTSTQRQNMPLPRDHQSLQAPINEANVAMDYSRTSSLFPHTPTNDHFEALYPAKNGVNELPFAFRQDVTLLDATQSITDSINESQQDSQGQQAAFMSQNSRRRDYTKAEKESFEQWIIMNPKPNRGQKIEFAKEHAFTENQLQNLINNRKRKMKDTGKKTGVPVINIDNAISLHDAPEKNDAEDGTLASHAKLPECIGIRPLAQSNSGSGLLVDHGLSRKSSYSSIEEYLKSPEDAVPIENIKRAAEKFCVPNPAAPDYPMDGVEVPHADSETPDLGANPLLSYNFNSPAKRPAIDDFKRVSRARSRQSVWGSSDGGYSVPSGRNSYSAASISSTLNSYSSSCRVRTKKSRRERSMMDLARPNAKIMRWGDKPPFLLSVPALRSRQNSVDTFSSFSSLSYEVEPQTFPCTFCRKIFETHKECEKHESDCDLQTFPCTFCNERFKNHTEWEDHETAYHCQPQLTWFCMLDARLDVEKCIFCGDSLPSSSHYILKHNLRDCGLSLHARTFGTRYEILQHLVATHGMLEEEVALIGGILDTWSLRINASSNCGLWRCGYCGLIGTDWDHRLRHIREHWDARGPKFVHENPWSVELSSLHNVDANYFEALKSGKELDKRRPGNLAFHGFDVFEAAVKHRARMKTKEHLDPSNHDTMRQELLEARSSPQPDPPPPPSFFASLTKRTKTFLGIMKERRKHRHDVKERK